MKTLLIVLSIMILIGLIVWLWNCQQKKKDPIHVATKTIETLERALERKDLSTEERFQLKSQLIQAQYDYAQAISALNDDLINKLRKSNEDKIQKLQEEMRKRQEELSQKDEEYLEKLKRMYDQLNKV